MIASVLLALAPSRDGGPACLLEIDDGRPIIEVLADRLAVAGPVRALTPYRWRHEVADALPGDVPVIAVHDAADGMRQLGETIREAAGLDAEEATAADTDAVLLLDAHVVTGQLALDLLIDTSDVRTDNVVLTGAGDPRGELGALRLTGAAAHALQTTTATLTATLESLGPASSGPPQDASCRTETAADVRAGEIVAPVLADLTRRGVEVQPTTLPPRLLWVRATDRAQAVHAWQEVRDTDEEQVRLDASVKDQDGFFTTFFVSPYSRHLARWFARIGLRPDEVTAMSLAVGVVAAVAFAVGTRPAAITGAVLLQAAFVLDCVDGQLARYTRRWSAFGGWLDATFDRAKEYAVYAGLAVGGMRAGDDAGLWLLAAAALTLQTVRHTIDFGYAEQRPAQDAPWSLVQQAEQRVPGLHWAKRIVTLPIGERFALISLVAAVGTPRAVFVTLLVWGVVAAGYTAGGRLVRTRR